MRRLIGLTIAVLTCAGVSACATDNPEPDVQTAPPAPIPDEAATPETAAWAKTLVDHALATEKAARDSGKADADLQAALVAGMQDEVRYEIGSGIPPGQLLAGLKLAANDSRDTDTVKQALAVVMSQLVQLTTLIPPGNCPRCTGKRGH